MRTFWLILCLQASAFAAPSPATIRNSGGVIEIQNSWLRLRIRDGVPVWLGDVKTGEAYSDLPYQYVVPEGGKPAARYQKARRAGNGVAVSLGLTVGSVNVKQEFFLPDDNPYLEERLALSGSGSRQADLGFAKQVDEDWRMAPIPWGRSTMNPYPGYPSYEERWLVKGLELQPRDTLRYGSEAWVLSRGRGQLLVSKYSPEFVEFSVLRFQRADPTPLMRFGGTARFLHFPENAAPAIRFGVTRYELVAGDWKQAFYRYRAMLEARGYRPRPNYKPEVFWNELFDAYNVPASEDTPDKRAELYTLRTLEDEARKAVNIGAGFLYLDPGWDTLTGSAAWATHRLGTASEFVKMMRRKYGLSVGVHTPFAGMTSPAAYPTSVRRLVGRARASGICGGSVIYLSERQRRLEALAAAGIRFMMFDGTGYTGDCSDHKHGHPIPYTREEHMRRILASVQSLHRRYPGVSIELHDPLIAGIWLRLIPMYYLYERRDSFDEIWASEFMMSPLGSLLQGPARGLYYYNLAYSVPLYEHIDLHDDTPGALALWWYASTCRHLGIGGTPKDPAVRRIHGLAMKKYNELSQFFKHGLFFGLAETVHAHTLPSKRESVLVLFNFGAQSLQKHLTFRPEEIGLAAGPPASIDAEIPARGAVVVKVGPL